MLKGINWKPYLAISVAFSIIIMFIKMHIGTGFLIGTIAYFLNLFLASKKFPSLDAKAKAVSMALLVMSLQGIVTIVAAVGCYFIGKVPCSLACFVGMIIPNLYFFIVGAIKK